MKLTGNTIVVTGGTSGIGKELVGRLTALGNTVITCGRREERLRQLGTFAPGVSTHLCDVKSEAARIEFSQWVAVHHPATNILINNAGIQLRTDLTKPLDLMRVRDEVETNLVAPLHFASIFAPLMANKQGAAMINISSGLAFSPIASMPVYCATKAAIHSLSLSMRRQMKDLGIAVFEIAPPSVDSELGHERWEKDQTSHGGMAVSDFVAEMLKSLEADIPEAAIGQAEGMRQKREALFAAMNH